MPDDKRNANIDRRNLSEQMGQRSQDAVRHLQDAQHHKFANGPKFSAADEKNPQQFQASADQESVDMQDGEEQQPEVPKVGSRDAPGG